jgi:hypothetical protein
MWLRMALLFHPLLHQGKKGKELNNKGKALMLDGPAYTGHSIPSAPPAPHLSLGNIQSIEVGYYKMQLGAMFGEALQAPTNEDIDN